MNAASQRRTGQVIGGCTELVGIDIKAVQAAAHGIQPRRPPFTGHFNFRQPQWPLMSEPAVESPLLTIQTRSDIRGHHASLHEQRAGTAHRIDQVLAFCGQGRPAGTDQNGRRQILFQRCLTRL